MDVEKTIKNIHSKCDIYMDSDLVSTIIDENGNMGKNNFLEIEGYEISEGDSYEERFLKILKKENIFINCGMLAFQPILNECDIFSLKDYTIKITQEEFDANCEEPEVYFGILLKKDSTDYKIGTIDLCDCKIDSGYRDIKKSETGLYKKLEEIINEMIIS